MKKSFTTYYFLYITVPIHYNQYRKYLDTKYRNTTRKSRDFIYLKIQLKNGCNNLY